MLANVGEDSSKKGKASAVKITVPCLLTLNDISRLAFAMAVDKTPSRKVRISSQNMLFTGRLIDFLTRLPFSQNGLTVLRSKGAFIAHVFKLLLTATSQVHLAYSFLFLCFLNRLASLCCHMLCL